MSKNRFFILIIGLIFISLPSKGFDIQSFLMTPEFIKEQTEVMAFKGFNNIKSEINTEFYDVLKEENIKQTIDSLLIKSARKDSSKYIKINERESMLIFFLQNACGMPSLKISRCDGYIHITEYIELRETNLEYIDDGKVETRERIRKNQIDILNAWYKDNKRYIKPIFKAFFSDLMSYYLALQYCFAQKYPNRDPRANGFGVTTGWKESLWPNIFWKKMPAATREFELKANGLFKSLISMYYWYKRNELNVLPPEYIIKSGIEMNNQPDQNCSNCREPELIYW